MSAIPALLVSTDDALSEEVHAAAAVAGGECARCSDPARVGEAWRTAPLVLLDGPAAISAALANPPPRPGVVIVRTTDSPELWRAAFRLGAAQVVALPEETATLVELFGAATENVRRSPGRVLAVLGGCGGAGASVLAAATAFTAAHRGGRVLLVDADPLGGGLDLTVGLDDVDGLRWSGLSCSDGRISAGSLREALPAQPVATGELALLSVDRDGPGTAMTPAAMRAVLDAGRRAGDTVICDVPRDPGEAGVVALREADVTVLVVPANVRACTAATRTLTALWEVLGPVRAVVRGPAPGGLSTDDVRAAIGVDVLTSMRPQPGLADVVDRCGVLGGRRRGPLWRAAGNVLTWLAASDSGVVGAA